MNESVHLLKLGNESPWINVCIIFEVSFITSRKDKFLWALSTIYWKKIHINALVQKMLYCCDKCILWSLVRWTNTISFSIMYRNVRNLLHNFATRCVYLLFESDLMVPYVFSRFYKFLKAEVGYLSLAKKGPNCVGGPRRVNSNN